MYARFAELHRSGCFVMPNPWDAGSLRLLVRLGFPAVATTSSGWAWSRGQAGQRPHGGGRAGAPARDGRRVAGAGERRLRGRLRGPAGRRRRQRGQCRERRVWRGCQSKTPPGTPPHRSSTSRSRSNACARRGRRWTPPSPACCSPRAPKASSSAGRTWRRHCAGSRPTRRRARTACTRPASARGPRLARSCGPCRRSQ